MPRSIRFRFALTVQLLGDILRRFPLRIWRLIRHLFSLFNYFQTKNLHGLELQIPGRLLLWLGEISCHILDILGLAEWFEIANCWLKPNSRGLNGREIRLAKSIFGDTLPYGQIQLDEGAGFGPKQYHFCYVSFCVINSWDAIPPAILIHELVHIWQFRRVGSSYILRALLAQRTRMGYDYGGLPELRRARDADLGLAPFNYEQQASIIEDYFRLQHHRTARWNPTAQTEQLQLYAYFATRLRAGVGF